MELRHLRYFIAVAEELHFGRAAARLFIAQPPLSQQIRQLEQEVGVPLFFRTQRHVELTDAGRVFLEQAQHIMRHIEQAKEAARQAHRGETGRLVLGFIGSATYDVLPSMLRAYREQMPLVEVFLREMTTVEQVEALLSETIDIGLLRPPIKSNQLELEIIRHEPIVVALPANHPLVQLERIPLQLLAQEPFILHQRQTGSSFYDLIITLCQQAGFSPNISQEAKEMYTIVSLVAVGIGVSLVPASVSHLRSDGVVYRELEGNTTQIDLALAWRRETRSVVIQNFLLVAKEIATQIAPFHHLI